MKVHKNRWSSVKKSPKSPRQTKERRLRDLTVTHGLALPDLVLSRPLVMGETCKGRQEEAASGSTSTVEMLSRSVAMVRKRYRLWLLLLMLLNVALQQ